MTHEVHPWNLGLIFFFALVLVHNIWLVGAQVEPGTKVSGWLFFIKC